MDGDENLTQQEIAEEGVDNLKILPGYLDLSEELVSVNFLAIAASTGTSNAQMTFAKKRMDGAAISVMFRGLSPVT